MRTMPEVEAMTDRCRAAHLLRSRARSLQRQAEGLSDPLATSYRRRARELELEAYLVELQGAGARQR